MMRIGLVTRISSKIGRNCMSTYTESVEFEKKVEHYRHLHELETNAKPEGWDQAKPFEAIPGPKPLPVVGNVWRFVLPKVGDFYGMDFFDVHKYMYKKYGEISILKGMTEIPMVLLYNPKDFETLFRNEGVWPIRRSLPSFDKYWKMRKDVFTNSGLTIYHGEKWFRTRTVVNPILMQPKNIAQYTDKMNFVADQLIDNIEYLAKQNNDSEMPSDFIYEIYKWSLESIGVVTLDTHLGCLKRDTENNSEPQKVIYNATQMFELVGKLDFKPSLYKYFSTRNWRKFVSSLDFLMEINRKHINKAVDALDKQENDPENEAKSALQQLLKKDRKIAVAVATDMMLAGVDTTGRLLGAGLYFLAKNPDKQKKLRDEATSLLETKNSPITKEVLSKAPYLKAVLKEVTRFAPIGIGNFRTIQKDLILGGYQVPKGTDVTTCNLMLCMDDKYFPRAKEFLPERWLSSAPAEISHKSASPFLLLPFGFGPRSCIGKRIAYLELELALLKIIRNFEITWPHKDMKFSNALLYGIADPLKIRVKPVQQ